MKRDKIVNNLTERLCSNAKSAVPIVDVFCLQAKLSPGRYNLYGNSLEFQVKYIWEKNGMIKMMKIPLQHLQHLWHDHHEVYPSANFGNRRDLKRRKELWALLVSGILVFSIFLCLIIVSIIVCLSHLAFVLAGVPGRHVLYLKHSFWDLVSSW